MLNTMDERTRESVRAALDALMRDGSPLVRADNFDDLLTVSWRRWSSYDRRVKRGHFNFEERVEDLAKGLRDRFEAEPTLVGPLMEDYRHLARTVAAEFETTN